MATQPKLPDITEGHSTSSSHQSAGKEAAVHVTRFEVGDDVDDDAASVRAKTKSTRDDYENMRRMGREQQLVRRFRLFSVASFVAIATASWELGLFLITPALLDGGRPNLIYSLIWSFVGFGPIYLSLAEMASMAPIAGAQYHWVSEFAPENCQKILSHVTGWTSTLAWQAGNALGVFIAGSLIQVIIQINVPEYSYPAWHTTLFVVAAVVIAYIGNVYGSRILPQWQNPAFAIHVMAYFALLVPIWVNAPRATHSQVWLEFENNGGWGSIVVSVLIGQVAGIYALVGVDTCAHMAEETKDAAKTVPKAMMSIYAVNFALLLPCVITLCYHIPVVSDSLADPTTYPAVYVLRQAMSPGWLTVLLVVILLLLIASSISYLAAVTRDIFAFSRDQGMPFSDWLSTLHPKRGIPQNSCIFSSMVAIALALIYLGSPLAFYAITSLGTVTLLQCYGMSIGCLLWRRIKYPDTVPPAQFSLGKWGVPTNIAAVLFSLWSFFWSFWPQAYPVTAPGFNWAVALFLTTIFGAGIDYVFRGRHKYHGPVALVRGRFNNAL